MAALISVRRVNTVRQIRCIRSFTHSLQGYRRGLLPLVSSRSYLKYLKPPLETTRYRKFSSDEGPEKDINLKVIKWKYANLWVYLKFWYMKNFIDKTLHADDILVGSKVAFLRFVVLVRQKDYTNMKGLVRENLIDKLCKSSSLPDYARDQIDHKHFQSVFIRSINVSEKSSGFKYVSVCVWLIKMLPDPSNIDSVFKLAQRVGDLKMFSLTLEKELGKLDGNWVIVTVKTLDKM